MRYSFLGRKTWRIVRLFAAFAMCGMVESPVVGEFRSIDGTGNNQIDTNRGAAGSQLTRLASPNYDDGISVPRGGVPSLLPSPRSISNAVSDQSGLVANSVNASDWIWQWGQFLTHDIDLSTAASPAEPFNVPVPTGDPFFDPFNTGSQEITMDRSIHDTSTGTSTGNPRQQINEITSYIDGSVVYGSNATRMAALQIGSGMLTTSLADNGEILPMRNTLGLPNAGGTGANLFLSGDIRANEQIGLTATHTLFVREHNRFAADLQGRLDGGEAALIAKRDDALNNNVVSTESEFIYQSARKVVGAQIQRITYEEFLPILLGSSLGGATTYDPNVDVAVTNEFSTASFRLGHSMLSPTLRRLAAAGSPAPEGNIELRNAFFNPSEVQMHGVDSVLLGLAKQVSQEVDTQLVDEVRNFLFGPPGSGGFDLVSLNIQRGRDHGLSGLNDVRSALGLTPYASFLDVTGGDATLANGLASVYSSVDEIDLWIGGSAEVHVGGGMVGETHAAVITDQFTRSRSGDRFFYTRDLEHLTALDPSFETVLLSDILLRNTGIAAIQSNVFLAPEPTGLVQLLISGPLCGLMWGMLRSARRRSR